MSKITLGSTRTDFGEKRKIPSITISSSIDREMHKLHILAAQSKLDLICFKMPVFRVREATRVGVALFCLGCYFCETTGTYPANNCIVTRISPRAKGSLIFIECIAWNPVRGSALVATTALRIYRKFKLIGDSKQILDQTQLISNVTSVTFNPITNLFPDVIFETYSPSCEIWRRFKASHIL